MNTPGALRLSSVRGLTSSSATPPPVTSACPAHHRAGVATTLAPGGWGAGGAAATAARLVVPLMPVDRDPVRGEQLEQALPVLAAQLACARV